MRTASAHDRVQLSGRPYGGDPARTCCRRQTGGHRKVQRSRARNKLQKVWSLCQLWNLPAEVRRLVGDGDQ